MPPTPLRKLNSARGNADHFVKLNLKRTQCVLRMTINGLAANCTAAVIRNGAHWHSKRVGSMLAAQFLLTDDIEQHSIACVVAGSYGFAAQLDLLVYRSWRTLHGAQFQAPKWNMSTAAKELERYLDSRPKLAQQRSSLDRTYRALASDPGSRRESIQMLHDAAVTFCEFLGRQKRGVLLRSFSEAINNGIDQDATLESLRQHPSWLVERVNGPISFHGRTYTTPFIAPAQSQSLRLDLSVPMRIIDGAAGSLDHSPDLLTSKLLLKGGLNQLSTLNQVRRRVTASEILTWSGIDLPEIEASRLRTLVVRIARLSQLLSSRTQRQVGGLSGLNASFRDFDLFEWSTFAAIGAALGAANDPTSLNKTELSGTESTLINVNKEGGAERVRTLLPGWRDSSAMPAHFLPDYIVKYKNRVPIPVDAKFRVADRIDAPCSAESVKEVQAYLNEFGLSGAVIVVPMIPQSIVASADSMALAITGQIKGSENRIWVVENDPSINGFERAFNRALEDIAELADAKAAVSGVLPH